MKSQKVYAGFDILKLILAIFVVAIHVQPFAGSNNPFMYHIGTYLFSMAVPFFFAMAGFLLFRKGRREELQKSADIALQYMFRMIKLYCIWNLIYLPISVYGNRGMGFGNACIKYVKEFLFVGEHYLSWPFWYLLASIYGIGIIWILIKCRVPSWGILVIGAGLYRFSDVLTYWIKNVTMLDGWRRMIAESAVNTLQTGRMFTSVLFLAIGLIIARNKTLKNIPVWIRGTLAFTTLAVYMYQPAGYIYMIGRPLLVFFGVWFLSGIKVKKRIAYLRMRNASTILYFTHMIWYFMYILLSGNPNVVGMTPFLFCVAGGTLISEIQILRMRKTLPAITEKVIA